VVAALGVGAEVGGEFHEYPIAGRLIVEMPAAGAVDMKETAVPLHSRESGTAALRQGPKSLDV
jgi:hypothetical protein